MLPQNVLSTETIRAPYLQPDGQVGTRLQDWERGGFAIQNTSQGLEFQDWFGYWKEDDSTVYLVPANTEIPVPLVTLANVIEFSFTFDQNMQYVLALLTDDNVAHLYWYDTVLGAYTVTNYAGINSIKLALDDKRAQSGAISDVLFTYINSSQQLKVRAQRDRYVTEYHLIDDVPSANRITNFGMAKNYRMQWRFQNRYT